MLGDIVLGDEVGRGNGEWGAYLDGLEPVCGSSFKGDFRSGIAG